MFFKRDVILAQEYLAFTLLNLFDLFLTGYIYTPRRQEANGLAAYDLARPDYHDVGVCRLQVSAGGGHRHGLRDHLPEKRPKARLVVTFGCFVYVLVVLYECALIYTHITGPSTRRSPRAIGFGQGLYMAVRIQHDLRAGRPIVPSTVSAGNPLRRLSNLAGAW